MQRKEALVNGGVYHVMNKSIAGFKIFHGKDDYERMVRMLRFYSYASVLPKFSQFLSRDSVKEKGFEDCLSQLVREEDKQVQIMAYSLMPTHIHLILKQLKANGISVMMSNMLNAYTRYFNTKRKRKGPLWVGKFKNVAIETDEQLLHVTRYVHLNPVTAKLIKKSEKWPHSSYVEFIAPKQVRFPLCSFREEIAMPAKQYKEFTEDNVQLQQELAELKQLALE